MFNKQQAKPLRADDTRFVTITVTGGVDAPGFKLNRLDLADQNELLELAKAIQKGAERGVTRDDPRYLDNRDCERYLALVEKGCGFEPGHFKRKDEEAAMIVQIQEMARHLRRPRHGKPRLEEPGAVVLPRQWCFEFVQSGTLRLETLGLLVWFLASFENNESLHPKGRLEAGGEELVLPGSINSSLVPGRQQAGGVFYSERLPQLVRLGFFEVERDLNRGLVIRKGKRLRNFEAKRAGKKLAKRERRQEVA